VRGHAHVLLEGADALWLEMPADVEARALTNRIGRAAGWDRAERVWRALARNENIEPRVARSRRRGRRRVARGAVEAAVLRHETNAFVRRFPQEAGILAAVDVGVRRRVSRLARGQLS
jgi:hypothetical protein